MPSTAIDSAVLREFFGTAAMRAVFSDHNRIQLYLDIEAALARVEARLNIIPPQAAAEISRQARAGNIDIAALEKRTIEVGSTVMPVVEQLAARCGEYGRYCHWGATTQDIVDTATVLQMRAGLDLVDGDLRDIASVLAGLAQTYRDTPMAGRTKLQHAVPITFGFKMAGFLAAIQRHRTRIAEIRPRVLVGEFGGAVGTLASLGARGLEVQAGLMAELGLSQPEIAWYAHRDRIAEVACVLAIVCGTLGKLATDVKLMMQTEVGEVFEPAGAGRGSSSTMPQKRNPVACSYIIACTAMVRTHTGVILESMLSEHERAAGPWEMEWAALPEIFILSAGASAQARAMLSGMEVDRDRMLANLDSTHGLIVAEAVMMGLAPFLGRERAHHLVTELCREALQTHRPLADVLAEHLEISGHLDRAQIERLTNPANYLGFSGAMVDQVLRRTSNK